MIKTTNITKIFDDTVALRNVSCTIEDGCIYGMVGSNGSGKSTLLRVLAGVYKADGGSATIDGEEIYENPDAKTKIAYVSDDNYLIGGASLMRMADVYASLYPRFDKEFLIKCANELNLPLNKSLNAFSKGMRRQAVTLLALATKPKVIFLDETFDGLDPIVRNYIKKLICSDILDRGASAIITSHSLRELEEICDHLALLHKGDLIFESDIQNIKTKQFKVQIAFSEEYDKTLFEGIDIVSFEKNGSVANMIVKGEREDVVAKLEALKPALLDILPLSLEEVFEYEMEALGYSFNIDELDAEVLQ